MSPPSVGRPSAQPDRDLPVEAGVVDARPETVGGSATPSFGLPSGAGTGIAGPLGTTSIGGRTFEWGSRTFVMGILNVTPDSFSGDGLIADAGGARGASSRVIERAVELARSMVEAGADVIDVGGESSRPGHAVVASEDEERRVVPVIAAIREALPDVPVSVDTTKPAVAAAAADAGAGLINDVWGVADDDRLARLAAERQLPLVVMHNRAEARYTSLVAEVLGDLARALDRALAAGCRWESLIVDPGFGFGKTPEHNLALLHDLGAIRLLARPVLLGTSRKSTLGKVLDLPPRERLEATIATTALGVAAGVDIVRVHDVRENVRAARMADAVVRRPA
jgi:dihydropteroate synthase